MGTIVLDECHHLASLWGYVVRAVVEALGEVHLVGLTATPPGELTREEAGLYDALLGEVDFTVPTPAVVREGHLAPYQELAWLVRPLESEARWPRFAGALNELVEPAGFPRYLVSRPVPGGRSAIRSLARALRGRQPFERRWVAVPADLGRRRERAEAFSRAWRRWSGPSGYGSRRAPRRAGRLAAAAAQPSHLTVRRRRIWL